LHVLSLPPAFVLSQDQTLRLGSEKIKPIVEPVTRSDGSIYKSNRLERVIEPVAKRHIMQVSTVTHDGDIDRIQLKPYARIIATLPLANEEISQTIPDFNPLLLFSEKAELTKRSASDAIYGETVEGEVTIRMTDLNISDVAKNYDLESIRANALARAQDTARFLIAAPIPSGPQSIAPDRFAAHDYAAFDQNADAGREALDAYTVNISTENVTEMGKNSNIQDNFFGLDETIIPVREGDTLGALLDTLNIAQQESQNILEAIETFYPDLELLEGQKVRLGLTASEISPGIISVIRISLYNDSNHVFTLSQIEDGTYLVAEEPTLLSDNAFETQIADTSATPRLYSAIYQAALANEVPMDVINDLVKIFAFDVDYQRRVSPGDTLELLYEVNEEGKGSGEILFTSLTLSGTTHKFYRYRSAEDGTIDYFDLDGRSARKFLLRKPVARGRFTSGFGMRTHPILKYRRMHNGVDWAAPRGTPIMAAGNGTVTEAKWKSGYGRFLEIRHANGYASRYAHLFRFADGIKVGSKVRLGQVVAYVGSTGLSTGPHLHYEVTVNGRHVDPMRIRVPRGIVLTGDELVSFANEQHRIDALMVRDRSPTIRVAEAAGR
jgi:murein DD-endopeptidase MepM/ murein hydrolase activator NlpD